MQLKEKLMNKSWENDKKHNFESDFGCFDQFFHPIFSPNFFIGFLLDVRNCCKLSLYSISTKNSISTNHFGPDLGPFGASKNFFFKNLTSSVTRYNGQLSRKLSEKTDTLILRKFSD